MAINKLKEEASAIYDIICTAGAITTEQVKKICEGKDINAEGTVRILCAERYTKWIDETYSIPFHKTNIDFLYSIQTLYPALQIVLIMTYYKGAAVLLLNKNVPNLIDARPFIQDAISKILVYLLCPFSLVNYFNKTFGTTSKTFCGCVFAYNI